MNTLSLDHMLDQLAPDPDLTIVEILFLVHSKLAGLPEHFECSTLYEPEEWEQIERGERISLGRALSLVSHLPHSPIRQDGTTTARHNRYTRK